MAEALGDGDDFNSTTELEKYPCLLLSLLSKTGRSKVDRTSSSRTARRVERRGDASSSSKAEEDDLLFAEPVCVENKLHRESSPIPWVFSNV